MYYRSAAQKGYTDAQIDLGVCLTEGWGCDVDIAEARRWIARAAAKGDEGAIAELEKLDA